MTNALLETGLPSFETVIHNAQCVFRVSLCCSQNLLVVNLLVKSSVVQLVLGLLVVVSNCVELFVCYLIVCLSFCLCLVSFCLHPFAYMGFVPELKPSVRSLVRFPISLRRTVYVNPKSPPEGGSKTKSFQNLINNLRYQ